MTMAVEYRYPEHEQRFRSDLKQLEGRTLRRVRLQVLSGEINLVLLELDDGIWSMHGSFGSELLQLVKLTGVPPQDLGSGAGYEPYLLADQFVGALIVQARALGCAWNGHGAEFSFGGHRKSTLLIQSIYAGDIPEGFNDCLRIGIGQYEYERQNEPDA